MTSTTMVYGRHIIVKIGFINQETSLGKAPPCITIIITITNNYQPLPTIDHYQPIVFTNEVGLLVRCSGTVKLCRASMAQGK
jgi:hypothetical protein